MSVFEFARTMHFYFYHHLIQGDRNLSLYNKLISYLIRAEAKQQAMNWFLLTVHIPIKK